MWLGSQWKAFELILLFIKPLLTNFSSMNGDILIPEKGNLIRKEYLHYRVHLVLQNNHIFVVCYILLQSNHMTYWHPWDVCPKYYRSPTIFNAWQTLWVECIFWPFLKINSSRYRKYIWWNLTFQSMVTCIHCFGPDFGYRAALYFLEILQLSYKSTISIYPCLTTVFLFDNAVCPLFGFFGLLLFWHLTYQSANYQTSLITDTCWKSNNLFSRSVLYYSECPYLHALMKYRRDHQFLSVRTGFWHHLMIFLL